MLDYGVKMNEEALKALETFKPRALDAWMRDDPAYMEQLRKQINLYPCIFMESCMFGIVIAGRVGSAWMLTGEQFEGDIKAVLKVMRPFITKVVDDYALRRLHMLVETGRKDAATWAAHLGFIPEAQRLERLGWRGEDMDMWIYKKEFIRKGM